MSCRRHPLSQLCHTNYPHCYRGYHLTVVQPLLCLVSKNRHKVQFDIFKSPLFLRNARLKPYNHKLDPTQHFQSSSQNLDFIYLQQEASRASATACSFGIRGTSLQQLTFTPGSRWNQIYSSLVWSGVFCIEKIPTHLHKHQLYYRHS